MSPGMELPENAFVVRGGLNLPEQFEHGSGVRRDERGLLHNVSVICAPALSVVELSRDIPNRQIGVTTVGRIRAAGGTVVTDSSPHNPYHCLLSGVDALTASSLFTPTVQNENRRGRS